MVYMSKTETHTHTIHREKETLERVSISDNLFFLAQPPILPALSFL